MPSVALGAEAVALLHQLRASAPGEWVIANPRTGKPYRSLEAGWEGVRSRAALPLVELTDLCNGAVDGGERIADGAIIALFFEAL